MKRNVKRYMVLLFGDGEYVHAYFFDDYIGALRLANLDISWNSNAQIYMNGAMIGMCYHK